MTTTTGPPVPSQVAHDSGVPDCPYVGLMPFDEKDAAYFFGRERESDLIVANLTAARLTLLYAPSGVGKSSVLRAGVLPALHHMDDDSYDDLGIPGTAVAYLSSWRDAPLENIASAVIDAVSRVTGAGAVERTTSAPQFTVSWLREILHQSQVSAVYLILDQFEEYFLYHPTDHGEEGLTAELGKILSARDVPVHVLLSIREDALAGLDRFKGRVPHLFDNYLRLAHLSRDAAQAAIEGPLDRYNSVAPPERRMSIEPGLITTLLDQVRTGHVRVAPDSTAPDGFTPDKPAADGLGDIETPFLQLVLTRLWDQERATGSSCLRKSTLDGLGGAQTIVQNHLDNVMAGLSAAQVEVAAAVFHHLVTASGTKIALTAEDLADWSGLAVSEVQDLLETLCSGPRRILRPLPPAVGVAGPPRYEIFHDVMGAPVLDWRRRYVTQRQQEEASRQLVAEREEAQAAARTARRRLRQTLLAVGLVVMLLVTAALSILLQRRSQDAQQQRLLAQQQRLLAQAAAALSDNPVQSLKYAVSAYDLNHNDEAREAVLLAASSPRSQVVAGPGSAGPGVPMAGMVLTPDSRHVVAYDEHGGIRVIGENGTMEGEAKASGLRGTVVHAAVNSDVSRVVLATDEGAVAVINMLTKRPIVFDTEDRSTYDVSWIGPADNGLIFVGSGNTVATYSPDTRKQVARLTGVVLAVPLPDEQRAVLIGEDGKLRVWDARTATTGAESSTAIAAPLDIRRYGQSVVVLSLGSNPSFGVWDERPGSDPVWHSFSYTDLIREVFVDERTATIWIAEGNKVLAHSLRDGSYQGALPQQAELINDVTMSPDGQWITTAGSNGRVMVWPARLLQPSRPTYELVAHRGSVDQVAYLHDGKALMSFGIDGTVRRWEMPQVPRFEQHVNTVTDDLSRDGSWLVTVSSDGHAFILDPHDLSKPPVATTESTDALTVVLFDPAEPHRFLTLGYYDTTPTLWRWGGDGKIERLQPFANPQLRASVTLVSIAMSPDGGTVAAGDDRGVIHFWDSRTGALRTDRELLRIHGKGQPDVTFDPTGRLLATADQDGAHIWKLGTSESATLLPHPYATSVAFDHLGEHLVSMSQDGTVKIWSREGKLVRDLVTHGDPSNHASFSSDDGLLAVGTAEGQVEIWNVQTGRTVMLERHHGASVSTAIFLPGERDRLISASDDMSVTQFSCPACGDPDRVIREAVEWAKAH